ncbi:MAG: murein hydrolase activator EnvC family protein [Micropepsaceae bacterium]
MILRLKKVDRASVALVALAASVAFAAAEASNPNQKLNDIQNQLRQDRQDIETLGHSAEQLAKEQEQLRVQLIRAAGVAQDRERELNVVEQRLAMFETREADGMRALIGQRGKLASLLAVLQRMGSEPPPALIVQPNDATAAARSAMLLTAVVPAVRGEARKLSNDLANLREMRRKAAEERLRVAAAAEALDKDRNVLSELLTQRRYLAAQTRDQMKTTQARIGTLAEEASDLRALIVSLNEDSKRPVAAGSTMTAKIASAGQPRNTPLEQLRGLLTLPANGELTSRFGSGDGMGGHLTGIHLQTRPGAQVTSPCDGKIAYAGTFRGYGKLLIIAANGGYHVLLAGLTKVDGAEGQVVLSGEPVGRMGAGSAQAGSQTERLYIEFRRNNVPVDPVPWFAALRQKVSG